MVLGALGFGSAGEAAQSRARRAPPRPVVVELFTAQGCEACLQANEMMGELAGERGVVALTFPVDYWDYLGWRDTFAKPEFTARQRAYAQRMRLKDIYTPEVVVNGRREAPGVDREEIEALVEGEARRRSDVVRPPVSFSRRGQRVTVGAGSAFRAGADVWLVRYDPTRRDVRVREGDNQGKTVVHHNLVRELVRLGGWNGRTRSYTVPATNVQGLRAVVLVQGAQGGPILSVARAP